MTTEQLAMNENTIPLQANYQSGCEISPQALIDPTVKLGKNVKVGPWTLIGPNVEIGDNTEIGAQVVITANTKLGKKNKVYSHVALGGDPQDLTFNGEQTYLEIGNENIFREFVTISRGSSNGPGITRIGNQNCFLAYSHVAHDCVIADEVLFVNHATIAGHVVVDHHATIGAFSAVHQFVRIGAYSFLSRSTLVGKDILPFMIVVGNPGSPCSLNSIGLKRNGFADKTIASLKRAYHLIFRRGLKLRDIRAELIKMVDETPEIEMMLDIIDHSSRGIAR